MLDPEKLLPTTQTHCPSWQSSMSLLSAPLDRRNLLPSRGNWPESAVGRVENCRNPSSSTQFQQDGNIKEKQTKYRGRIQHGVIFLSVAILIPPDTTASQPTNERPPPRVTNQFKRQRAAEHCLITRTAAQQSLCFACDEKCFYGT